MNNRLEWVDIAKGILIILVIVGHAHINPLLDYIINSFHMASFFVLSGFTSSVKDDYRCFFVKKTRRLLIPYLLLSILLLLYQYLSHIMLNTEYSIVSGISSVFIPISGRSGTTVYHLWFLPCIFLADMCVYMIIKCYTQKKLIPIIAVTMVMILAIFFFLHTGIVSVISLLPISVFYILLGHRLRIITENYNTNHVTNCLLSVFLLTLFVYLNYRLGGGSVDMSSLTLGLWPLYLLSGIAGSLFTISLSQLIKHQGFLSSIGKNSLYYYGLHYEILGIISRFCWRALALLLTVAVLYVLINFCAELFDKRKVSTK